MWLCKKSENFWPSVARKFTSAGLRSFHLLDDSSYYLLSAYCLLHIDIIMLPLEQPYRVGVFGSLIHATTLGLGFAVRQAFLPPLL